MQNCKHHGIEIGPTLALSMAKNRLSLFSSLDITKNLNNRTEKQAKTRKFQLLVRHNGSVSVAENFVFACFPGQNECFEDPRTLSPGTFSFGHAFSWENEWFDGAAAISTFLLVFPVKINVFEALKNFVPGVILVFACFFHGK